MVRTNLPKTNHTRQVGEAVRIGYRRQTLNSRGGYNRSGIFCLVLEESKLENVEDSRGQEIEIEEQQDPFGLKV